jgi:hypothetical protein
MRLEADMLVKNTIGVNLRMLEKKFRGTDAPLGQIL